MEFGESSDKTPTKHLLEGRGRESSYHHDDDHYHDSVLEILLHITHKKGMKIWRERHQKTDSCRELHDMNNKLRGKIRETKEDSDDSKKSTKKIDMTDSKWIRRMRMKGIYGKEHINSCVEPEMSGRQQKGWGSKESSDQKMCWDQPTVLCNYWLSYMSRGEGKRRQKDMRKHDSATWQSTKRWNKTWHEEKKREGENTIMMMMTLQKKRSAEHN